MFDEPVLLVTDFCRTFLQYLNKYIYIATMSLKKYFILIYKLRNTEHYFVSYIKYVGCDLIDCNWQMFVSTKFTLIPVNRINKMHLV